MPCILMGNKLSEVLAGYIITVCTLMLDVGCYSETLRLNYQTSQATVIFMVTAMSTSRV
jgi:hypothetical protein